MLSRCTITSLIALVGGSFGCDSAVVSADEDASGGARAAGGGSNSGTSAVGIGGADVTARTAPPAEGAVSFSIFPAPDSSPSYGCDAAGGTALLGITAPTATSQGAFWVDGLESHKVSCTINGVDRYSTVGEIRGEGKRFSIIGEVTKGGNGTASVSLFEPSSALAMQDSACEVTVSGNYTVEDGAIWAGFNCAKLVSPDDIFTWCAAEGIFVFKSCGR